MLGWSTAGAGLEHGWIEERPETIRASYDATTVGQAGGGARAREGSSQSSRQLDLNIAEHGLYETIISSVHIQLKAYLPVSVSLELATAVLKLHHTDTEVRARAQLSQTEPRTRRDSPRRGRGACGGQEHSSRRVGRPDGSPVRLGSARLGSVRLCSARPVARLVESLFIPCSSARQLFPAAGRFGVTFRLVYRECL